MVITVTELKTNNMSGPFKMKGMSFKEDQTPLKTINLSKIAGKIKKSKLGQTKLGQAIGNLAEKGGKVQEGFVKGKRKLGLKTPGYDATMSSEEREDFFAAPEGENVDEITPEVANDTDENVDLNPPSSPVIKKKKSPARNYKKGYYGVKK